MAQLACVDRTDYRIRITGVATEATNAALEQVLHRSQWSLMKIRHFKTSTIIRFLSECEPMFVEEVSSALLKTLCPCINRGLLKAFERRLMQEQIAAAA
jgi:hypothetical protein